MPFLARWQGRIPANAVRRDFFHHVDLMATLCDAASVTVPTGASPDGRSELRAFLDPVAAPAQRTEGVMHGTASMALRQGSWIYLPKQGSGGKTVPEPAKPFGIPYARMGVSNSDVDETGKVRPDAPPEQLYDLSADPSQRQNRAAAEPDRLKAMRERLKELTSPDPTRGT